MWCIYGYEDENAPENKLRVEKLTHDQFSLYGIKFMTLFNIKNSRNLTLPDMYINIGHFLDHFMMLILLKEFDAGCHFGLSYDEIIIYGTLGLFLLVLWHL